jgi:hypothetical protein
MANYSPSTTVSSRKIDESRLDVMEFWLGHLKKGRFMYAKGGRRRFWGGLWPPLARVRSEGQALPPANTCFFHLHRV